MHAFLSRIAAGAVAALMLTAADETPPASEAPLPAGEYRIDPTHSTLAFRVNHLGFSNYVMQFTSVDTKLTLDPADPARAALEVTIDPRSLALPSPPAGFLDTLLGAEWLDAGQFPSITYRATAVDVTGEKTARVTGDLTLHGVTKPVVLDVTFNGGYAGHPMDPYARIGFSATGRFNRSDFGIAFGIPAPGTTMGVSDEVQVSIETELTGPALAPVTP